MRKPQWQCNVCKKPYVRLRNCQNHMVTEHGYLWWDDKDICVGGNQIHTPTGHINVELLKEGS